MPRNNGIGRDITAFLSSLKVMNRSLRRLAPMLSAAASTNGAPNTNGRSRPRLSSKARVSMVLQGRYMGYMRQLKPRQKAQVRKVRKARGVKVAIGMARELAST